MVNKQANKDALPRSSVAYKFCSMFLDSFYKERMHIVWIDFVGLGEEVANLGMSSWGSYLEMNLGNWKDPTMKNLEEGA